MKLRLALIALLAASACTPKAAIEPASGPDPVDHALPAQQDAGRIVSAYGFDGEIVVSGGKWDGWTPANDDHPQGVLWPWASVTKQVVATMIMQAVERGELTLDTPLSTFYEDQYLEGADLTVRDLLTHRSDLRNPDDSAPSSLGFPSAYSGAGTDLFCLLERQPQRPDGWAYNNCDYMVLGGILARLESGTSGTREHFIARFERDIAVPAGLEGTRLLVFPKVKDVHDIDLAYENRLPGYSTSGALAGPLSDMIRFDRALMSGTLIGDETRAAMWQGDPALGFMALGQWSFEAPLKGCDGTVHIIERRGAIGKYQVRNIIFPDKDIAVALALVDEDFDFGEIWTGAGFMHDILSAIACEWKE